MWRQALEWRAVTRQHRSHAVYVSAPKCQGRRAPSQHRLARDRCRRGQRDTALRDEGDQRLALILQRNGALGGQCAPSTASMQWRALEDRCEPPPTMRALPTKKRVATARDKHPQSRQSRHASGLSRLRCREATATGHVENHVAAATKMPACAMDQALWC